MGKPPVKSVEDKNRIVIAVLRGEITIAAAARREDTSQTSIANWRDLFLAGGQWALEAGARHGALYAGARSLQSQLPDPAGTEMPVVVLRVRGRLSFGATFAVAMSDYIDRLADVGGHLILSGVEAELMDQLRTSGGDDIEEHLTVYEASSIIGESTNEVLDAGQDWLRDRE
jgi:transposase-like protein